MLTCCVTTIHTVPLPTEGGSIARPATRDAGIIQHLLEMSRANAKLSCLTVASNSLAINCATIQQNNRHDVRRKDSHLHPWQPHVHEVEAMCRDITTKDITLMKLVSISAQWKNNQSDGLSIMFSGDDVDGIAKDDWSHG
jgi:hypothetical protein